MPEPLIPAPCEAAGAAHEKGAAATARSPRPPVVPRIDSRQLLARGAELVIAHGDKEYRLRLTRNDRLILTR